MFSDLFLKMYIRKYLKKLNKKILKDVYFNLLRKPFNSRTHVDNVYLKCVRNEMIKRGIFHEKNHD